MLIEHSLKLAVAVAAMALGTGIAQACRCAEASPEASYGRAAAVVVGKVVDVEGDFKRAGGGIATLRSTEAWKASVPASIRVSSRTTCAIDFQVGQSYVVYLQPANSGGYLTQRCMGTAAVGEAGEDIQWLKAHGSAAPIGN